MAEGPDRGLVLTLPLEPESALAGYPELADVRATFLQQLGRLDEAREQFRLAAEQTTNTWSLFDDAFVAAATPAGS
jgi:predicted RNA polymerase sigma factor